ncbi:hypothetical protein Celaphus_00010181 [Cervus elaphus hippelaphus]|uniref:Uncharacterized protein n=1 Tax=Cervus elaphus hippelaphus TaxID=46360 RepID=A0A212C9Q8_CEREH|nr:hypothetical protein Celaphus_00010181 [Cervus elaphus hippelaphus]
MVPKVTKEAHDPPKAKAKSKALKAKKAGKWPPGQEEGRGDTAKERTEAGAGGQDKVGAEPNKGGEVEGENWDQGRDQRHAGDCHGAFNEILSQLPKIELDILL